jgi:hypothetical protein
VARAEFGLLFLFNYLYKKEHQVEITIYNQGEIRFWSFYLWDSFHEETLYTYVVFKTMLLGKARLKFVF